MTNFSLNFRFFGAPATHCMYFSLGTGALDELLLLLPLALEDELDSPAFFFFDFFFSLAVLLLLPVVPVLAEKTNRLAVEQEQGSGWIFFVGVGTGIWTVFG